MRRSSIQKWKYHVDFIVMLNENYEQNLLNKVTQCKYYNIAKLPEGVGNKNQLNSAYSAL